MSGRQDKRTVLAPLFGGGYRPIAVSGAAPARKSVSAPQNRTTNARSPDRPGGLGLFLGNAEGAAKAGVQSLAALGRSQASHVKMAGNAIEHAVRPLGLLGEGFDIYDDYKSGKPMGVIAARSGARQGALWGASKAGAAVMAGPGAAAGGALGLGAGGVGAGPGALSGAVVGGGIGGFIGGVTADAAGLDDLAAEQAERTYWYAQKLKRAPR